MSQNTNIQFKRTALDVNTLDNTPFNETLQFGEPLLIHTSGNEKYLVIGPVGNETEGTSIENSIFFKGVQYSDAQHGVTYDDNFTLIATPSSSNNTYLKVKQIASENKAISNTDTAKYYIVCQNPDGSLVHFEEGEGIGIYVDGRGVMHGAAWNDYAEARKCDDCKTPNQLDGYVVCEKGDSTLTLSSERLQPCPYVVSDTFGTVIGIGNVNVAVAGKALVYTDDEVELGDCLAAGENGKAVKMTRQEIINYPDRILGIVTEIPDYPTFNEIEIKNRVWVRIK